MSEMEQLKADLQALQRTHELLPVNGDIVKATLRTLTDMIQARIKELEAPPDPYRWAKIIVKECRDTKARGIFSDNTAFYAAYLEDEVERLKTELENRPVVWCLKSKDNGIILTNWKSCCALFESSVAAEAFRNRNNYKNFEPAIYTGKESG